MDTSGFTAWFARHRYAAQAQEVRQAALLKKSAALVAAMADEDRQFEVWLNAYSLERNQEKSSARG